MSSNYFSTDVVLSKFHMIQNLHQKVNWRRW